MKSKQKLKKIIELIDRYGMIDGSHHKQWLIDQIVRTAVKNDHEYLLWKSEWEDQSDDDDDDEQYWNEGIAP